MKRLLPILLLVLARTASAQPTTLYLANDDHTDWYWTATGDQYRQAFQTMLDYYMDQAEATASNPPDSRGRFNPDGSLWFYEYEQARTPTEFARLIQHAQDGNISVPAQSLVILPGAMSTETVLRDMYYAGSLERRFGLDVRLAVAMENQTLPGGIASLWAGSGIDFSWKGICACVSEANWGDRPREIYQFVGPDGQGVLMKWNTLLVDNQHLGGYAEARQPANMVTFLESDPDFLARWPYDVAGAFGFGWDDFQTTTDAFVQASLNFSNPNRRVVVSNITDFFEDFLAQHALATPTFAGSFGNEWDLFTASLADVSARMRRAVERLRTAEALAAVVHPLDPTPWTDLADQREWAHLAMGLYYDHDWTADGPVGPAPREQFQRDAVADVEAYVDALHTAAAASLGERIVRSDPGVRTVAVFNPLGWDRTDVCQVEVPTGDWHVVRVEDGVEVPSQIEGNNLLFPVDVPALGYRTVEIRPGTGAAFGDAASVNGSTLDNGLLSVDFQSDGSVTSVVDHADGDRELVGAGGAWLSSPHTGAGSVSVLHQGPVRTVLRATPSGNPARTIDLWLTADDPVVWIESHISQNFGNRQDYGFDFALTQPEARHEEVGMVAVAAYASEGGDYADENARVDWLTSNHFIDLSQPTHGVTLSDPDGVFWRLGQSTPQDLDTGASSLRTLVGMQIDPPFGFAGQGGDTSFRNRYALRPHGARDNAEAMRFSLQHQNPLVAVEVTAAAPTLPADAWSMVATDHPGLVPWTVKPAEDPTGGELVVRVWNLDDAPSTGTLDFRDLGVQSAREVSHIESGNTLAGLTDNQLLLVAAPQQMRTFQFRLAGPTSVPTPARQPLRIQAVPNPFNPRVSLRVEHDGSGPVELSVHDLSGRLLYRARRPRAAAGTLEFAWDGTDPRGRAVASGVYLVRASAGAGTASRKITLVR